MDFDQVALEPIKVVHPKASTSTSAPTRRTTVSIAEEAVARRIAKAPGLTEAEVEVKIATAMATLQKAFDEERARWAELTELYSTDL